MWHKQVVQIPATLPVKRGFPRHSSIPVIFEKFQTNTSMARESLPTKKYIN